MDKKPQIFINNEVFTILENRASEQGKTYEQLVSEILTKAAYELSNMEYSRTKAEARAEKIAFIKKHYTKA